MRRSIGFIIVCFCPLWLIAKPSVIKGIVLDTYGEPIPYATIQLLETYSGTTSFADGTFQLKTALNGTYTLSFSCIGYQKKAVQIELGTTDEIILKEVLKTQNTEISELTVAGKTKATQLREESYAVEVLESKTFKNLAVNANEILNKIPGVNIRQSGGFGEKAELSLNGLTGSQVRIFMDGIPMEFFGSSLSLNNFPANIFEQIEVYKGVVPIHLSADALGGAVNITTNKSQQSFLDASYGYGSFNTHKAAINAQVRQTSTGFTSRIKSFYNYSDNNYKVDIKLLDASTGKTDDFTTEVEHFHDAYRSKMGWLEAGFTQTQFADELMLGVMYSDNYNETQQPTNAIGDSEQPYGEVFETEKNKIATLHYEKKQFLTDHLSFNTYLVYVKGEKLKQNISNYVYDWFGNKTLEEDGTGERDERLTALTTISKNLLGNVNASYALSDFSNLAFNYNLNFYNLSGDDPYNGENNTRFGNPISFDKQVWASSYTHSFFNHTWRNTAFIKYYTYTQKSTDTNYFGEDEINTSANYKHLGYGLATSYFIHQIQLKASFEHAIRFPDVLELYGDGTSYEANPYIQPEESDNYNLGTIYKTTFSSVNIVLSSNGFIRNSKQFIFAQREGQSIISKNLDDVLTMGGDFSTNLNWKGRCNINLAGTYIHQVNNDKYNAGGPNALYKQRIPNEPYFYGNATLSYLFKDMLTKADHLSVNVHENFTHEFDYRWSILGFSDDKYAVPQQITTDLDFVYSLQNQRYNFSFGIINLFDADTYDNLLQQNPGRSYHFKIRYFLN